VCSGAVVGDAAALEQLRFCDVINGSLVIEVAEEEADFTALRNIEAIQGMLVRYVICMLTEVAGSLVVRNSSMTTLEHLWNLETIGSSGATETVEGRAYSLVITGS
jgi:hypothetical protein